MIAMKRSTTTEGTDVRWDWSTGIGPLGLVRWDRSAGTLIFPSLSSTNFEHIKPFAIFAIMKCVARESNHAGYSANINIVYP